MCFLKENVVTKKELRKKIWILDLKNPQNLYLYSTTGLTDGRLSSKSPVLIHHNTDGSMTDSFTQKKDQKSMQQNQLFFFVKTRLLLYPQCNSLLTVQEDVSVNSWTAIGSLWRVKWVQCPFNAVLTCHMYDKVVIGLCDHWARSDPAV